MFNQFSGIDAILYYANDIFARAGYGSASAGKQAVALGLTNLLFLFPETRGRSLEFTVS